MTKHFLFSLITTSVLVACDDTADKGDTLMPDPPEDLRQDLHVLMNKRIYLGHQSVGFDIVNGVKDLYAMYNEFPQMQVITLPDSPVPEGAFFAHSFIGKNGDPDGKCDAFQKNVDDVLQSSVDIALMKFCYADIGVDRNVEEMFTYYAETMKTLKGLHPGVTFVHVTVPVTERSSAWKRIARGILGREDEWDLRAVKREEFNAMLRQQFAGEPLFDLASIESTYPDGGRTDFEYKGKKAHSLISEYTYDGGHLNETGRRIVARELVRTLAAIVRGKRM